MPSDPIAVVVVEGGNARSVGRNAGSVLAHTAGACGADLDGPGPGRGGSDWGVVGFVEGAGCDRLRLLLPSVGRCRVGVRPACVDFESLDRVAVVHRSSRSAAADSVVE